MSFLDNSATDAVFCSILKSAGIWAACGHVIGLFVTRGKFWWIACFSDRADSISNIESDTAANYCRCVCGVYASIRRTSAVTAKSTRIRS
jgi:hypothetical protein